MPAGLQPWTCDTAGWRCRIKSQPRSAGHVDMIAENHRLETSRVPRRGKNHRRRRIVERFSADTERLILPGERQNASISVGVNRLQRRTNNIPANRLAAL